MSSSHDRPPLIRAANAALVLAAAVCTACTPAPSGREVYLRGADLLFASQAPVPHSTADHARDVIASDTRPVLARAVPPSGPAAYDHARLTMHIPAGAVLELAYGVRGRGSHAAPETEATFRVRLVGGAERVLLEDTVRAGEAGETDWKETTIPLPRVSGATLVFSSSLPPAQVASVVPLFSTPVVTVPARQMRPRNVILVSLDTLRADHLGTYGYSRATSPHMDQLFATGGIVVDRVYSQAANTLGGHVAMLDGMLPTAVMKPSGRPRDWRQSQSKAALSLAERLRARGYRTAAFTEDALLDGPSGFNRGFDDAYYEELKSPKGEVQGHIEQTFDRGLAWLARHHDQAFFLFLHTYQVHHPYTPPPAYAHLFPTPDGAGPAERDCDLYDREIVYTDAQVARLVREIDALGLRENTILVITSDHGEEFGEHRRRRHGTNVTDEILHVPLLLRAPGLLPAGARRAGPMALMDLVPTLLDLLGHEVPPAIQGRSLADHLRRDTPVELQPIFSEARGAVAETYSGIDYWYPPSFAVTLWPWRLARIRTAKAVRYELYDLAADPGETRNLFPEREADVRTLKEAVDLYEQTAQSVQLALERGMQDGGASPAALPEIDPARDEKMRALGYLD